MNQIFFTIFIFYGIGFAILWSGIQSAKQCMAASNWPFVTGKLTKLALEEISHKDSDGHRSTGYQVKVEYSYSVMGGQYTSSRLAFGYVGSGHKEEEQKIFDKLQQSSTIKVRYNPNDPSISTLSYGIHRSLKLNLTFAMTWLAFVFGVSSLFLLTLQSDNVLLANIQIIEKQDYNSSNESQSINSPIIVPPSPSPSCVSVQATSGWQTFSFSENFTKVMSISGGWTVDARNYGSVGSYGHIGQDAQALTPYNQYKYDQKFPFGALLINSNEGVLWLKKPIGFTNSFNLVYMRINDADNALGDNQGNLLVCFGK